MVEYYVEYFDGISGDNKSFPSYSHALKFFDNQVDYYSQPCYFGAYWFVELNKYRDGVKVKTLKQRC
jgi:hypothetical protein